MAGVEQVPGAGGREHIFACEHRAQRSNWKWGKALNSQRVRHDSCLFLPLHHSLLLSHFMLLPFP